MDTGPLNNSEISSAHAQAEDVKMGGAVDPFVLHHEFRGIM